MEPDRNFPLMDLAVLTFVRGTNRRCKILAAYAICARIEPIIQSTRQGELAQNLL